MNNCCCSWGMYYREYFECPAPAAHLVIVRRRICACELHAPC